MQRRQLAGAVLALIGGFSSSVVQNVIKRMIDTLETVVRGSAEAEVAIRAQTGKLRVEEAHGGGAQFDLSLLIGRSDPTLAGHLEYATGVFDAAEAEGLLADLTAAVAGLTSDGGTPLVFPAEREPGPAAELRRLVAVLGPEFGANAVPLAMAREGFALSGHIGLPTYHRGAGYRARYGRGIEVFCSAAIILSYLGWVAAQITALGLVFSVLTGGAMSETAGMIVGTLAVLIYVVVGVFMAVAVTDFIQMIVLVVGLSVIAWFSADLAGGTGADAVRVPDAWAMAAARGAGAAGAAGDGRSRSDVPTSPSASRTEPPRPRPGRMRLVSSSACFTRS